MASTIQNFLAGNVASVDVTPFVVNNGRNQYHLIPYVGNKSGFAHVFDALVPESAGTQKIYDLFGGGASFSIYCSYRFGSQNVTYNDNNPIIVNFLKHVKESPKPLLEQYLNHKQNSSVEYYLEMRDKQLDSGLAGAGRFLYLAKNAFSGKIRFNGSNKFNTPMRKSGRCPGLEYEQLGKISKAIKQLTITNESYDHYEDVQRGFLYLDPPYMENTNGHYNGVPKTQDFVSFVAATERQNLVMISEHNDPRKLGLPDWFKVHPILLKRSLQYNTRTNSCEIIAINYKPDQKPTNGKHVAL